MSTRPTIFYVRHGLTDWNAERRFQGRKDIPLNQMGQAQAKCNGEKLRQFMPDIGKFDFIASPLNRTRHTMEIMRKAMGLKPDAYREDARLIEAAYGDFEGVTINEIEDQHADLFDARTKDRWNFQPPNGESLAMVLVRVQPLLDEIVKPTVIVAHGAVGRTVRQYVLDLTLHEAAWFEFPQDKVFRFEDGKEVVV